MWRCSCYCLSKLCVQNTCFKNFNGVEGVVVREFKAETSYVLSIVSKFINFIDGSNPNGKEWICLESSSSAVGFSTDGHSGNHVAIVMAWQKQFTKRVHPTWAYMNITRCTSCDELCHACMRSWTSFVKDFYRVGFVGFIKTETKGSNGLIRISRSIYGFNRCHGHTKWISWRCECCGTLCENYSSNE